VPSNKGQESLRHSQNTTVAAMAMADMKVWAHRLMMNESSVDQMPRDWRLPENITRFHSVDELFEALSFHCSHRA
jgi:hypothetical protein